MLMLDKNKIENSAINFSVLKFFIDFLQEGFVITKDASSGFGVVNVSIPRKFCGACLDFRAGTKVYSMLWTFDERIYQNSQIPAPASFNFCFGNGCDDSCRSV